MRKSLVLLVVFVCSLAAFGQDATEGSLFAVSKKGAPLGACPLKTTGVKADISGFIARVNVRQEFQNSFSEAIEAVYVFPLPQNGAVDRMTMTVGTRVIRGKIMKREEARQVYETAKTEGKTAALLDQERPNVFTQSVANIMPGESVIVEISYVETLKYEDGAYEFVFPMVVGPRYIPADLKDAARIKPPVAETRAGHDISIEVNLNAGVPVESIRSASHEIDQVNLSPAAAKITLRDEKTIPNKDFILRYDVTGKRIEDAVLVHRDARGGFFTMILQPPDKFAAEDRTPKEIVFVLDTSGSMSGFPIEKAKEAMRLSLDGLYPDDTFNLITFAGDTRILFDKPVPATQANMDAAQAFLSEQYGSGGTEMMKAIKAALEPSDAADHVRIVCFMTDGYVGNENEIVAEVQKHPNARVFSFGIGSSVNRFLLDRVALEGKGEAEYVALTDDGSRAAKKFYERVRTPLLTDLSIDWNTMPVADVYPGRLTDLFIAKPVILHGRYTKAATGTIKLRGKVAGMPYERNITINLPESEAANDVLSTLWARTRIDELSSARLKAADEKKGLEIDKQITNVGLEFGLMTSFTSFVAVEDRIVNHGGKPLTKEVPVELPEGTKRDLATAYAKWISNDVGYLIDGASGSENTFIVGGTRKNRRVRGGKGKGQGSGTGHGYGGGMGSGTGAGTAAMANLPANVVSVTLSTADASAPPPPRVISAGVINTQATNLPKPTYPSVATGMNAQGTVSVQVVIDESGKVVSATPVSGHPLLRAAATDAARRSTFAPTMLSGQPVKVIGLVVYSFTLAGTSQPTAGQFVEATPETLKPTTVTTDPVDTLFKQKLHTWLYDALMRLAANDTTPSANESLFVRDGKADIQIELTARAAEVIEKLKVVGFEFFSEKGKTIVVGRVSLDKLASLADIEEVKLILPKI